MILSGARSIEYFSAITPLYSFSRKIISSAASCSKSNIWSFIEPTIARRSPVSGSSNFGQRIPGVSRSSRVLLNLIHCFPFVTPGLLPVFAHAFFAYEFINVDLPTFGIPTTIARTGRFFIPRFLSLSISFSGVLAGGEGFFFFLDDDARGDGHEHARCFTSDSAVGEESLDVRNLAEDRDAAFITTFAESLDTAEESGSAVRHVDRGVDGEGRGDRFLDRGTLADDFRTFVFGSFVRDAFEQAAALAGGGVARGDGVGSFELIGAVVVGDLAEEGDDGHSDVLTIGRSGRLNRHELTFVDDRDDGLLSDGEVSDDGDNRADVRHARGVADARGLTVEHRDFRSLKDVGAGVGFRGGDKEVGFNVAQDRET